MKNIIAIDPSFTRSGIAILYNDELVFHKIEKKIGEKSFQNIYLRTNEILSELSEIVAGRIFDISINEVPPPVGIFSAGLYMLDSLLLKYLRSISTTSYIVHPRFLTLVHGHKYTKHESVVLAKDLLVKLGFTIPKTLSNDEAEAFLFLCRILKQQGLTDSCLDIFPEKEILID